MTDQQEVAEPVAIPEIPVTFHGREIYVRMPKPEQLLVWQRTLDRLTKAPVNASWTGSEVMAALERLRRIVDSILVNKIDVEWLDDQFLDGELDFETVTPLMTIVVNAFADLAEENAPNRDARRAVKKTVKKATRKKATA